MMILMGNINKQLQQSKEQEKNLKARLDVMEDELLREKEEKKAIQDHSEKLEKSIEVDSNVMFIPLHKI